MLACRCSQQTDACLAKGQTTDGVPPNGRKPGHRAQKMDRGTAQAFSSGGSQHHPRVRTLPTSVQAACCHGPSPDHPPHHMAVHVTPGRRRAAIVLCQFVPSTGASAHQGARGPATVSATQRRRSTQITALETTRSAGVLAGASLAPLAFRQPLSVPRARRELRFPLLRPASAPTPTSPCAHQGCRHARLTSETVLATSDLRQETCALLAV